MYSLAQTYSRKQIVFLLINTHNRCHTETGKTKHWQAQQPLTHRIKCLKYSKAVILLSLVVLTSISSDARLEGRSAAGASPAATAAALGSLFAAEMTRVVSAQVHYCQREAIVAARHCTFVSWDVASRRPETTQKYHSCCVAVCVAWLGFFSSLALISVGLREVAHIVLPL